MARDADIIQADIDKLQAALSRGVLRVRNGDSDVTYNSPSALIDAINALKSELGYTATTPIRQVRFQTDKGL